MEEINWQSVRAKYPVLDKCTYLNTASSGPISKGTANVMKAFAEDQLQNATINRSEWIKSIEEARSNTAKLINAEVYEIGFTPDVSIAMSFISEALTDHKKVALLRDEFPSVLLPWISHEYEIDWIERSGDQSFNLADFETALKAGVRVVIVSWVHYNSGIVTDLGTLSKLCREYGALLVVDGTQGLGAIPIDVKESKVDIFVASTFKWLTGGYGNCIVYASDRIKSELDVRAKGWNSLVDFGIDPNDKSNWKTGASSFELGHLKYSNLITFGNALKEIQQIDTDQIQKRISRLKSYLIDKLASQEFEPIAPISNSIPTSGIITIRLDHDLFEWLSQNNVVATYREDYIRLSVHFYNDFADVDRLVDVIAGYSHPN